MENMLSVKEVAERFDKDTTTIQRWIKQGHLPGSRKTGPGKTSPYIVPEKAVTALMETLVEPQKRIED